MITIEQIKNNPWPQDCVPGCNLTATAMLNTLLKHFINKYPNDEDLGREIRKSILAVTDWGNNDKN